MSEPGDFLRPSSYKKNLNEKLPASYLFIDPRDAALQLPVRCFTTPE